MNTLKRINRAIMSKNTRLEEISELTLFGSSLINVLNLDKDPELKYVLALGAVSAASATILGISKLYREFSKPVNGGYL
ncbi:MAG: hypothetical protein WC979_06545 [Candidatus Pacearchaeota archaeon]|jgi:hypothetical protein